MGPPVPYLHDKFDQPPEPQGDAQGGQKKQRGVRQSAEAVGKLGEGKEHETQEGKDLGRNTFQESHGFTAFWRGRSRPPGR